MNDNLAPRISSSELLHQSTVIYSVMVTKPYLISKVYCFSIFYNRPNHSFTHHHSIIFTNMSHSKVGYLLCLLWRSEMVCYLEIYWLLSRASWLVCRYYVRTYTKWLPNIFYNHLICPKLPKHNNWYTLPPHTFK